MEPLQNNQSAAALLIVLEKYDTIKAKQTAGGEINNGKQRTQCRKTHRPGGDDCSRSAELSAFIVVFINDSQ
ncbi:MAG: hypothetical protein E7554_02135 [Ruminococcaceae bacterium]|nr:hypothetical protein [Oscillospiraceae bacterium]